MNHHLSPTAIVMSPTTIAEITPISTTSNANSNSSNNVNGSTQNSRHKTLINQNNNINDTGKITKVINSKSNEKSNNADGFRTKTDNTPLDNSIEYKPNNDCDRLLESNSKIINSNISSNSTTKTINELITIVTISDSVDNKIENNLMSPGMTSINPNDCNITNGNSKNEIDILAHL